MLTLTPPPLPDESLYSLLCRAYMIDAGFTYRLTLKYIFNPMERASDLEMIGGAFYKFWESCLRSYWSFPKTIAETTMYRLYTPFMPFNHRKYIVKRIGSTPLSIRLLLEQHFYAESLDLYYLKYCPACIADDVEEFGVPYWHRSHCCKYSFACHKHKCGLEKAGFLTKGEECFQLPCFDDAGVGEPTDLLIEEKIYQRLNNPVSSKMTLQAFKRNVFDNLKNREDSCTRSDVADTLQDDLHDRIPDTDLSRLGVRYQYPDGDIRRWVKEFLTSPDRTTHLPEAVLVSVVGKM